MKSNRRLFLKNSSVALASGFLVSEGLSPLIETEMPPKNAFAHHVFFWLKNPDNKEEYNQLLTALKGLKKIEVVKYAHIGAPSINDFDRPVTDATYSFSVLLLFNSKKDEETYLYHPLHKKFGADNNHLWSKVMVYDSAQI
jgi:Stress responsive A/B Barrel Domain